MRTVKKAKLLRLHFGESRPIQREAAVRSDRESLQGIEDRRRHRISRAGRIRRDSGNPPPSPGPEGSAHCRHDCGYGGEPGAADSRSRGDDGHRHDRHLGRGIHAHRKAANGRNLSRTLAALPPSNAHSPFAMSIALCNCASQPSRIAETENGAPTSGATPLPSRKVPFHV